MSLVDSLLGVSVACISLSSSSHKCQKEVSVEFVGPQQPNGEMAQWGNMAQRGKCGST